jgi:hypothetical protein
LADFFAFFAFFAFLAMLPSVIPKLAQCKPISTCIHSNYTTIAKLILRASKKVNARHRRDLRPRTKPSRAADRATSRAADRATSISVLNSFCAIVADLVKEADALSVRGQNRKATGI